MYACIIMSYFFSYQNRFQLIIDSSFFLFRKIFNTCPIYPIARNRKKVIPPSLSLSHTQVPKQCCDSERIYPHFPGFSASLWIYVFDVPLLTDWWMDGKRVSGWGLVCTVLVSSNYQLLTRSQPTSIIKHCYVILHCNVSVNVQCMNSALWPSTCM